jgi:hypothetical protein
MAQANREIFSKRQRRNNSELPDVYQYEKIPAPLRVKVDFIIKDALRYGKPDSPWRDFLDCVHRHLLREYGRYFLVEEGPPADDLMSFFLQSERTPEVLDVIEAVFLLLNKTIRENPRLLGGEPTLSVEKAIDLLNARFREHGVGYQFENGSIVRVDSQLIHVEVVRPLLGALQNPPFSGALAEFTSAHERYRHGSYKECLNECNKSFESVMKAVCAKRGWTCDPNATAKGLIKVLFDNQFFPKYMETQLSALRNLLESGVPPIRNKNSGHGQGVAVTTVPEELATYCLHLTATNLLYIVRLA